jgi:hypothetical protein
MIQADHMLGIPGDSIELQERSLLFYNENRPDLVSVFWLTYYPKTALIDRALAEGILTDADVERIEAGWRLTDTSYLVGGSMQKPGPYYSVSLLLNYLPLLPRFMVRFLVRTRLYRVFRIRNYFISTALPRVIGSLFNRRDFRGRHYIARFMSRLLRRPRRLQASP